MPIGHDVNEQVCSHGGSKVILASHPAKMASLVPSATKIVLLSGYANAGKDSVRAILERHHGFVGMAFADGVRVEAMRLNRYLPELYEPYLTVLDRCGGYESAKRAHPCIREYLVDIGHGYRQKYGQDYWVQQVHKRIQDLEAGHSEQEIGGGYPLRVCVSDCRYVNERFRPDAEIWYIERPGVTAANATEAASLAAITPDHVIRNDGTLADLEVRVADLIATM